MPMIIVVAGSAFVKGAAIVPALVLFEPGP
jgi:hypothetical protein